MNTLAIRKGDLAECSLVAVLGSLNQLLAYEHDPAPEPWDEHHLNLYFAIPTGTSRNKPWIVFRYSLRTHRVTRMLNDYGAGFASGEISRSGQYLAYVQFAALGACATSGSLIVADLWTGRLHTIRYPTASAGDVPVVESLRWKSPTEGEYETAVHSEAHCRTADNFSKRRFTEAVNVEDLPFR